MLFACASGRHHTPHIFNGSPQGVNGTFYDGSARWVSVAEVRRLAIEGSAVDGSNGGGYSDPKKLLNNTYNSGHWSGNYYKLQYVAHENLGLNP